jgi:hypothetical protein
MMGRDDGWLLDNLTLHDPRGNGTGLTQQHSMSCNSAMTMAMQGSYDPIFALGLRIANPDISRVNEQDPTQFNADLAAREKGMLESPYQGQNQLGAQGQGGQAVPRAHQGAAAGRWADDLLNNMLGRFGMTFGTEVGLDPADAVRSLDEGLMAGMHVPVVIGSSATSHAHYVMATGRRDGAGGVEYRFHNTANGQSVWVPAWQILSHTMPLLGGQQITAVERPRAVGPFTAAGGVPMAGGGQPLTQAAAPQLANLAVSAVTQTIPVSVAATAIAVQANETAPQQAQEADPQAQENQQTPSDKTRQAASAPTLRIPLDVQQAVREIVHPRAVAALNNLEQPKEPGAAMSKDDAERQKFTEEWRGRKVDLAAFKATYDMEYEDAVDKLARAKSSPAVAAVLNQVPEEELVAIILYMSTHYVEMNRTLRERDKNSLGDVGDAIALADRGLEKLPSYQGWCSRGVESSSPAELAARYVPGQMVTEDGFTSTSSAEGAQYKGTVQFRIKSENGKVVESFSRYEKEKEVLFRPGSRFMVTEKERDGDIIIITMEEVAGGGGPGGAPGGPGGTGHTKDTTGDQQRADDGTREDQGRRDDQHVGAAQSVPGSQFVGTGAGRGTVSVEEMQANAEHAVTLLNGAAKAVKHSQSAADPFFMSLGTGEIMVTDPNGTNVRVKFEPMTGGDDVARHNYRAGQSERTCTVFVSEKARPEDLTRAIAHELAEIQSIAAGAKVGQPAMRQGSTSDELDAHDVGRKAEVQVLLYQAERSPTVDTATELEALVTHLGFDPKKIGTDARAKQILGEEHVVRIDEVLNKPRIAIKAADYKAVGKIVGNEWVFAINVPLPNGRTTTVAHGSVTLKPSPTEAGKFIPDETKSLDFTLNNQEDVDNRRWRIKLEGAEKLSDFVIKEATRQFEEEFHESPVLGGGLAWDNKARFQHAYAEVMRKNPAMDPQEAADLAILQTPYGSARDKAGYDVKVTATGEAWIVTGDPPRLASVPEKVSAVAKKR